MKTLLTTLALCLCLAGVSFAQTIPAQSNPNLGTFFSLLSKRPDLRVNMSRVGLDAAFSDWLRAYNPAEYKIALKQTLTTKAATSNCCSGQSGCCGACCDSVKAIPNDSGTGSSKSNCCGAGCGGCC